MINVPINAERMVSDGTVECFKLFATNDKGEIYSPTGPFTFLTEEQTYGKKPIYDPSDEMFVPCTVTSKNIVSGFVDGFKKRSDLEFKVKEGHCTDCVICRCIVPKGVEYYDDLLDDCGRICAKALVIADWDTDVEKTRKLFQENNPGNVSENVSEKPVVFSDEIRKECPTPNPIGDMVKATEQAIERTYAKEITEINAAIDAAARNGDQCAIVDIDMHKDDSRWRRIKWLFGRHGYNIHMGITDITVSWENAQTE